LAIKIVDRTTPEASRESVDASIPKPLSGKSESGARQVSDGESKTPSFKPTPSSGQTSAAKPQFSSAKSLTKKALIQHLDSILAHKHRTWFERPVTDKQAPGYSSSVKNPLDIQKIKSRIRSGECASFAELKRDILLMLTNGMMYNSRSSSVHKSILEYMVHVRQRMEEIELNLSKIENANEKVAFTTPIKKRRHSTPNSTPASTPGSCFGDEDTKTTPSSAQPLSKLAKKIKL